MRVGIIGAGAVGSTLATAFAAAGHDVAICNSRDPETLDDLVERVKAPAPAKTTVRAATLPEAARYGEVVVLAIPFGHCPDMPASLGAGKVVLDATNYYPDRDGHVPDLDAHRTTSSEMVQRHLPDARVVKAFNTMRMDHVREYARHSGTDDRYGIPVAADDDAAKRMVFDLINDADFDPVDAGPLRAGRRQEPDSEIYTADLPASVLADRLGAPSPVRR